jgi:hypothetical protein
VNLCSVMAALDTIGGLVGALKVLLQHRIRSRTKAEMSDRAPEGHDSARRSSLHFFRYGSDPSGARNQVGR